MPNESHGCVIPWVSKSIYPQLFWATELHTYPNVLIFWELIRMICQLFPANFQTNITLSCDSTRPLSSCLSLELWSKCRCKGRQCERNIWATFIPPESQKNANFTISISNNFIISEVISNSWYYIVSETISSLVDPPFIWLIDVIIFGRRTIQNIQCSSLYTCTWTRVPIRGYWTKMHVESWLSVIFVEKLAVNNWHIIRISPQNIRAIG